MHSYFQVSPAVTVAWGHTAQGRPQLTASAQEKELAWPYVRSEIRHCFLTSIMWITYFCQEKKRKLLNYFTHMLVSDRTLEVTWGRKWRWYLWGASSYHPVLPNPRDNPIKKDSVIVLICHTRRRRLTRANNLAKFARLDNSEYEVWNQDPMTPKHIALFTMPRFSVCPHSSHELSAHPGPSDHRFCSPLFSIPCTCIQVGRPFSPKPTQ